jgi:hypothetical protein
MISKVLFVCLLIGLSTSATYNETFSKLMASYSAISHCHDNATVAWNCRECNKVDKLIDVQ